MNERPTEQVSRDRMIDANGRTINYSENQF